SFVERFLREARAMARLQHDNIVSIYAVEEDQQTQFLVMEFCAGSNLRALIRNQPQLSLQDAVRLSHQLASALAYAHGQGIIHRDIKPANVLVDKKGKAKLTDFGIAAALDEASITMTGQVIGTPEYMSPEQARGLKLDGRSDLYSLGIMMYEMLTGRTPYAVGSKTSILGRLAYEQDELELNFPPTVPSMLQGVVRDLVRRNPEARIPDADILANQLHEILFTIPGSPAVREITEGDATVVAPVPQPAAPPSVSPVDDRTIASTYGTTQTSVAPGVPEPSKHPPSVPPRHSPPSPVLDETTVLPAQPHASLGHPRETPSSAPRPPLPASPAVRLLPWIGGGVAIVLALSGLVYFLANYGGTIQDGSGSVISKKQEPRSDQPAEIQQPGEGQRSEPFQQLSEERKQLSEDQARLAEKQRQAELQRTREEAEQRELASRRERTTKEREAAAQRARAEEEKRKAQDTARLQKERQTADIEQRARAEEQRRSAQAQAGIDTASQRQAAPLNLSAPQVARAFPDPQLQALLNRFKQAYEHHDWGTLQALSTMTERRRVNVEFMFSNYTEFRASIQNVTQTEEGATATLVLETGTRSNGETIEIPPLSRKYALHIPQGTGGWDRIKW
ncbi:MAG TPA: protein kinase, partial [Nitrospiraceae bacterium]|nr:protein kinase [Nitrospiraceae bacterium]